MQVIENPAVEPTEPRATRRPAFRSRSRRSGLIGGGVAGNEQLTAMTGMILIVLLAVLGLTILRIQQLISVHLFLGFLLLGPVALKMASTGYRFARYYARNYAYRKKGPPEAFMRLIAPFVVLTTVVVFASGVVLLVLGPANRGHWVAIHKVSFILWLGGMALHVLGHLAELPSALRATATRSRITGDSTGVAGRWIALAGALVAGLILAIVLIPDFSSWTASGAFFHGGGH
jgi:hypothetical protein